MKINPKNYLWAIPLVAALLFSLNIYIQESFDKFRPKTKQAPYLSVSGGITKAPDQADISADTLIIHPDNDPLPFELRGTIVGTPCLAFIYNLRTNRQNVYKLNESVENYKIIKIASAKIIVERNGKTKELLIAGKNRNNETRTETLYAETDGTMVISKAGIRKKVIPEANQLLSKIKILPMQTPASDKLKGFRIDNVPPGSIVESAGIKSGDIIYSIEGRQLISMREAWLMFDKIKTQPRFEVVVLRGDKPVTLRYKMKE